MRYVFFKISFLVLTVSFCYGQKYNYHTKFKQAETDAFYGRYNNAIAAYEDLLKKNDSLNSTDFKSILHNRLAEI